VRQSGPPSNALTSVGEKPRAVERVIIVRGGGPF
jgi:hypothetical protein